MLPKIPPNYSVTFLLINIELWKLTIQKPTKNTKEVHILGWNFYVNINIIDFSDSRIPVVLLGNRPSTLCLHSVGH